MSKLDDIIDHATHEAIIGEHDIDAVCTEAINSVKDLILELMGERPYDYGRKDGNSWPDDALYEAQKQYDELRQKVNEL